MYKIIKVTLTYCRSRYINYKYFKWFINSCLIKFKYVS